MLENQLNHHIKQIPMNKKVINMRQVVNILSMNQNLHMIKSQIIQLMKLSLYMKKSHIFLQ